MGALNVSSVLPLVGAHAGHNSRNEERQCPPAGVCTHSTLQLSLHFLFSPCFSPCFSFIKLAKECPSARRNVYLPGREGRYTFAFKQGPASTAAIKQQFLHLQTQQLYDPSYPVCTHRVSHPPLLISETGTLHWKEYLRRENVAITWTNMLIPTAVWRQSATYKTYCFPLTFHELIMGGC